MISPELLRRYPFFSKLQENQLKSLAMLGEEIATTPESVLFAEKTPAEWLYLLVDGSVGLSYKSEEEFHPKAKKEFAIGEINPGEVFGISAVIEPYTYNSTASVEQPSRIIRFEASALRDLISDDRDLGFNLMGQIAKTALERLTYTRVQLAAAWA
jgi:CRP-like cAMP-binding protein